jgi:hypothetical protein
MVEEQYDDNEMDPEEEQAYMM